MSRWRDLFAELSDTGDTVGTMRHSGEIPSTVSQSVHSVSPPASLKRDTRPGADVTRADGVGGSLEDIKTTDGSIAGALIAGVSDDRARAGAPLTLSTQLTLWTEGLARLDPDRPPADVQLKRWEQFLADARRLADDGVVAHAAAAGWTAYDLFGCDDEKPFSRLDQMGLVWFVKGGHVVSISMSAAVIETLTGARQTFRRKDGAPGRVLAWELFNEGKV